MRHNTEDKLWWTIQGAKQEEIFVEDICPRLGLQAIINPAKQLSPYVPDMIVEGKLSDLKCQETPFFKAGELFQLDPQFAVTFNKKDYQQYADKYPNIMIYYWVNWQYVACEIRGKIYLVRPMSSVWRVPFSQFCNILKGMPIHNYKRRVSNGWGNAKESYVFDVRQLECLHLKLQDDFVE